MNAVKKWCIENVPPPKLEGCFYAYAYVQMEACGYVGDVPGRDIRKDLEDDLTDLFLNYGIGVQLGAQSHGRRGIRLFNMR